jgi:hypothetical protein
LFAPLFTSLDLRTQRDQQFLATQLHLSHADQILCDFDETLLAFQPDEAVPIQQILVDLQNGFIEISG